MNRIETFKNPNDLCLVKYNEVYFIGYVDLPQEDWTVKHFNEWRYKSVVNLISLNADWTPQRLPNSGLKIEVAYQVVFEQCISKYNPTEDKLFGINRSFSFKELLLQLLNESNPKNYWIIIENYISKPFENLKQ